MKDRALLPLAVGLLVLAAALGLAIGAALNEGSGRPDPSVAPQQPTDDAESSPTGSPTEADGEPGTLSAQPAATTAAANARVGISGTYAGAGAGVSLAVQRQEDGEWADFPASATTGEGGSFSLDVALGLPGENVLRVVDTSTGTASEPFTITVP